MKPLRRILYCASLPFRALWAALAWTADWFWHIFIASFPPAMAIWMMQQERRTRDPEDLRLRDHRAEMERRIYARRERLAH